MHQYTFSRLALFLIALLFAINSCQRVPDQIEPHINYAVQDRYLRSLPSPFPPLSDEEIAENWGKEYLIGISFAHQLDLYQAITAFKRAEILLPQEEKARRLEVQYEILLCYYVGRKYEDAIASFESSDLKRIDTSFPACHDMLMVLYDSYLQVGDDDQARRILQMINQVEPEEAPQLALSSALIHADLPLVRQFAEHMPETDYLEDFLADYEAQKKSVGKAQTLNAFIPGTGYLYLGQTQSAITAFLLNGLFIAATVNFFIHDQIAAGVICASFEAGWYFGGIFGAGLEAKYYNERLYERLATPMMNQHRLFPILRLNYAF
ncbi:MAG: tetratricopeptide repeat protein [Verrucomicrobia bacterium]|nr:tetratricopeptide repeat protein [Verrucomicrobiota bacterium]